MTKKNWGILLLAFLGTIAVVYLVLSQMEIPQSFPVAILLGTLLLLNPYHQAKIYKYNRQQPTEKQDRLNPLLYALAIVILFGMGIFQIVDEGEPLYGASFFLFGYAILQHILFKIRDQFSSAKLVIAITYLGVAIVCLWSCYLHIEPFI